MIRKIKKEFKKLGFIPSRTFDKNFDYHLVREFDGGKQVIVFCVLDEYKDTKYVFEIYFYIYFDEINEVTVYGNKKYQRFQSYEAKNLVTDMELDFLHIPVVDFELDYIYDTYRDQPLDKKCRISDDESLAWFIQLYDYEIKGLFEKYSDLREAEKSLDHPKSFYKKWEPHWNGCILKLYFAAKKSKANFLEQLEINEAIYQNADEGFRLNLPRDIYDNYIQKVREAFKSSW